MIRERTLSDKIDQVIMRIGVLERSTNIAQTDLLHRCRELEARVSQLDRGRTWAPTKGSWTEPGLMTFTTLRTRGD